MREEEKDLREAQRAAEKFTDDLRGSRPMQGSPMGMRQTGVGALKGKIDELRRRAAFLERLVGALPADLHALSPEADAALWELACSLKV